MKCSKIFPIIQIQKKLLTHSFLNLRKMRKFRTKQTTKVIGRVVTHRYNSPNILPNRKKYAESCSVEIPGQSQILFWSRSWNYPLLFKRKDYLLLSLRYDKPNWVLNFSNKSIIINTLTHLLKILNIFKIMNKNKSLKCNLWGQMRTYQPWVKFSETKTEVKVFLRIFHLKKF